MGEEKVPRVGKQAFSPVQVSTSEDRNNEANFRSSIKLKYVKLGIHYLISNALYLLVIPLLLVVTANLVDFACYKPNDPSFVCTREKVVKIIDKLVSKESAAFTKKVLERSGLGDNTYAAGLKDFPPRRPFACAREEAEMIIFETIDNLFTKTNVKPRDIGIVIVNVSAFNPMPSLSAMIVNRYKLRGDVVSCNLGGMGCSAGLIAIDLKPATKHFSGSHINKWRLENKPTSGPP